MCVVSLGQRIQTFSLRHSSFLCLSVYSWELLVAAGEEREVPGALHARDEQGGVLSEWKAGDVLDRGGRPQQHAL